MKESFSALIVEHPFAPSACDEASVTSAVSVQRASVTIPVKDESGNIEPICEAFANLMKRQAFVREVIFVNDGSRDTTLEEIEECSLRFSFIRFFDLSEPRGKGAAIKLGFQNSLGEIVIMMDGDQQYSPFDIPSLLEPIFSGSCDLVIGRGTNTHSSLLRRQLSRTFREIFGRIFGIPATSPNEGMKAIIKARFDELGVSANGFDFDLELLVKAKRCGFRIREVTVKRFARSGGKSKIHILPAIVCFLWRITMLCLIQRR